MTENKIQTLQELKQFKSKTMNDIILESDSEKKQMLKMLFVSTCQTITDLEEESKNQNLASRSDDHELFVQSNKHTDISKVSTPNSVNTNENEPKLELDMNVYTKLFRRSTLKLREIYPESDEKTQLVIKTIFVNRSVPLEITITEDDKPDQSRIDAYKEKRDSKMERYQELSDKHKNQSDSRFETATKLGDMIPMGQPILVGHHSERGHRNHLKKIDNNMRKGIEHKETSEYYDNKVKTIENNYAISSDDPEAIIRLKEKIAKLEEEYEKTKALKKIPRDFSFSPEDMRSLHMTSFRTKIRTAEKRIEEIRATQNSDDVNETINGIKVFTDKDANRVKIEFGYKPTEETRTKLKSQGFRWSPYNMAWQASLKPWYIERALEIVKEEKKD